MSKISRSVAKPQSSPNVETYLRNLRLLDLDEEFDWPSITAETFAAHDPVQNQKSRVRSAEWALYKLLYIWDSEDVCKNLQQFFPAYESLQSANLRAAIFRTLSDLKKEGVFDKEIFIRRSTLDDCKGPRFEEVLAILSTAVVRKVLATDEADQSIVKQLILTGPNQNLPYKSMLPLTVCYRAILKRRLVEKRELEQRYRRFGRLLDMKKDEVGQRTHDLTISARPWRAKNVPKRTVDKLGRYLDTHWYGDKQWVDILIRSDRFPNTNSLLERPFEKVWPHICDDTLHKIRPEHTESLLQSLEKKVVAQSERLERWKNIHEGLLEVKERREMEDIELEINSAVAPAPVEQGRLTRSSTKNLQLESNKDNTAKPPSERPNPIFPAKAGAQRKGQSEEKQRPIRKQETYYEAAQSDADSRSPSVADALSPTTDDLSYIRYDKTETLVTNAAASKLDLLVQATPKGRCRNDTRKSSKDESCEELEATLATMSLEADKIPRADASNTYPVPLLSKPKLSLVERTRISMANISPTDTTQMYHPLYPITTSAIESPEHDNDNPPQSPTKDIYRSDTLADRTRQSMSLMSARPQRRTSHKARPSISYPTNQFESPRKKPSSFDEGDLSILDEILPDLDVDYETVFKSRPKIAVSPQLSPIKIAFGEMDEIDHAFA